MFYDPAPVKEAKIVICDLLKQYSPILPLEGPVKLECVWLFNSKSHKKEEWRITKPDTDNLQKGLKDCMTKTGFWKDDAQVVYEISKKRWSQTPGIFIRVEEINET